MSIEYMFFDNQQVTADMMNNAIKKIFSGGITSYEDGKEYGISKLNDVYYNTMESGIVSESDNTLKVSINGGSANIFPGTCIFPDGSHATVTSTETVALLESGTSYISLCSDTTYNSVYAQATDTMPDGNVVVLASVTDGIVTDLRKYAKAKISSMRASDYGLVGMKEVVLTAEDTEIRFKLDYEPNFLIILPMSLSGIISTTVTLIDIKADAGLSFYYEAGDATAYANDSHGKIASASDFKLGTYYLVGNGMRYLNGNLTKDGDEYVINLTRSYSDDYIDEQIFPLSIRLLLL